MSFINGYVFEVNEFPVKDGNCTVKDYFYYDSNVKEYGDRLLIVPVSEIANKEVLPDIDTIKTLINNNVFFMTRSVDFENKKENWTFNTNSLEEINK